MVVSTAELTGEAAAGQPAQGRLPPLDPETLGRINDNPESPYLQIHNSTATESAEGAQDGEPVAQAFADHDAQPRSPESAGEQAVHLADNDRLDMAP